MKIRLDKKMYTKAQRIADAKGDTFNRWTFRAIASHRNTSDKPISMDEPISTQTTSNKFTLCTPIIVDFANGGRVRGADQPMPTLTAKNSMCVATPIVIGQHSCSAPRSSDEPCPIICTAGAIAAAFPITSEGKLVDVCFRMLSPQELKMATGFPRDYVLTGTKTEMVKQIGNAVPVNTARELVKAALTA